MAAKPKLTVAEVLHHLIDRLGLHDDTAKNLHQVVDDNLATEDELAERARNPWADKDDQAVIEAAIAGDQDAAAEYRHRKEAETSPATSPPAKPEA